MDDQLIRQEPTVAAQALLELAEANVSPLAHEQAWETEIGFLSVVDEDEDKDLTALVSAMLKDETMLA
jgi:hypothetical protein